jgi:F-type H+-transporting ATPase subunit b
MTFGFSWSTFVVEIVNFLILIWLLTRFFYQPVMRTIATREQRIKDELTKAQEAQSQATGMMHRYEARLADWEAEKAKLREQFDAELGSAQAKREAEFKSHLEGERRQAEAAEQARERDDRRRLWQQAAGDATRFASRLLSRLASPAVEQGLVATALDDLRSLPDSARTTLTGAANGKASAIVTTRFPLDDKQRAGLIETLESVLGNRTIAVSFKQDVALVAGLRIELGSATVDANIGTELRWFAQVESNAAS